MLPARTLLLLGLAAVPLCCQSPERAAAARAQGDAALAEAMQELNLQLDQLRNEVSLLRLQMQMAQVDARQGAHARNLEARRAELATWLEEARRTMTDEHPRVREVVATIAALDREIANQAMGPH